MKIGDECISRLKGTARPDKNIGIHGRGSNHIAVLQAGFQHANSGRTYGCNMVGGVELISRLLIKLKPLRMHRVLFNTIGLDRCKGAQPHMQRYFCLLNTRGLRSEEHTSELQSRFDLVCRLLLEKKK